MPELVALQTMLPKIETPFEAQGKALQLRQLINANDDAEAQRQLRAQSLADDASYRQALQANPTGGAGLLSALAGAGNYKGFATAQKAEQDALKAKADIGKSNADTQKTQLESISKANSLIGSAAGALKANPTYENATATVAQLQQTLGSELSKQFGLDTVQIPQDPRALAQWADQHYLAAVDADKQLTDARVRMEGDANRKVQTESSLRTAASSKYATDSSAATARARLNYDKTKDAAGEDSAMDPLAIRMAAQQVMAGDSSVLTGFGRGAQGATNLKKVREEVARMATAQGLTGADLAAKTAEFGGMKAGARTTGTRTANIEIAANEAAELAPIAVAAGREVARSGLLPFGKAQVMFDSQTNDPKLRQFVMANMALRNAYAQVMSRGGTATVSDKQHAEDILSTAFDQPSYEAAVQQLQTEIKAAQKAPRTVRKNMSDEIGGRASEGGAAPAGVPDDIAALLKKHGGK